MVFRTLYLNPACCRSAWGSMAKWGISLSLIFAMLQGCGRSDTPPLAQVTGVVMRDGAPLSGAGVEFRPAFGRSSPGMTDENGRFQLDYTIKQKGALIGDHVVHFRLPATIPPHGRASSKQKDQVPPSGRSVELVPLKYHEEVVVKAGKNEFTFDLTGKD